VTPAVGRRDPAVIGPPEFRSGGPMAHEMTGRGINNVLRYACLRAMERDPPDIRSKDLVFGIRRELHKEGKFWSNRRVLQAIC
jgi:hypothetical protein